MFRIFYIFSYFQHCSQKFFEILIPFVVFFICYNFFILALNMCQSMLLILIFILMFFRLYVSKASRISPNLFFLSVRCFRFSIFIDIFPESYSLNNFHSFFLTSWLTCLFHHADYLFYLLVHHISLGAFMMISFFRIFSQVCLFFCPSSLFLCLFFLSSLNL